MFAGPPSEPAGVYIDSNTVTETSVMIQWKAAGDNNQNILSYVIEANNTWEGFYRIIRTSTLPVSFILLLVTLFKLNDRKHYIKS